MLVSIGGFPLDNISLLLFLDTVNFYSCENASGMRYRKETMLYWIFGWLMFHGKWLRFNRGIKFSGSCLETDSNRGFYSPDSGKTCINFAVPSDQVIQNYANVNLRLPSNLQPGVIKDLLKAIPDAVKEKEQFVLSFDGKMLRTGNNL